VAAASSASAADSFSLTRAVTPVDPTGVTCCL
jgi:hypothetical protein